MTTYPTNYNITYTAVGLTQGASNPFTYAWSFDDGATASTASTVKQWATEGNHTATVTATDTVTGGVAESFKTITTAHLFFPDLPDVKSRHRAFLVGGRVWVVQGSTNKTYSIAPGDLAWTVENDSSGTKIAWNTNHGMAINVDTKIYCFGGTAGVSNGNTDIFDTVAKTWSSLNNLTNSVYTVSPVVASNSNYIFTFYGYVGNSRGTGSIQISNNTYQTQSATTSDYTFNGGYPVVSDGSTVWILSSNLGGEKYTAGVGWSAITGIGSDTYGQFGAAEAITDGVEWLISGGNLVAGGQPSTKTFKFNKNTGYSNGPDMSVARKNHTMTRLANGKIFICCGNTNNTPDYSAKCDLYDPATGLITAMTDCPIPRSNHTATLLANGGVMITGGFTTAGAETKDVSVFYEDFGWL